MHNYKERSKYRGQLTDADWGLIFEELINRDLIDLPDTYIHEEKQISKPDELEQIFLR